VAALLGPLVANQLPCLITGDVSDVSYLINFLGAKANRYSGTASFCWIRNALRSRNLSIMLSPLEQKGWRTASARRHGHCHATSEGPAFVGRRVAGLSGSE